MMLLTFSCNDDDGTHCGLGNPPGPNYCIINESNHKTNIELYEDGKKTYEELDFKYSVRHQARIVDTLPHPYQGTYSDFIVKLTYDDTISVWFRNPRTNSKFDIRNKYNYVEDRERHFIYTLTEADYQYALEHREENE